MSILDITALPTNKDKIVLNAFQDANIIPRHPFSVIFNGKTRSGKSNLLITLMTKPEFYGGFFDQIYLFAGSPDEAFKLFNVKKKNTFIDSKVWNSKIKTICDAQSKIIEKRGIHNTEKVLFIFEDIINHASFMRKSEMFTKLFVAGRHYNASVFLTTQSWTRVPRVLRLQAFGIFYFQGSGSEKRLLAEEHSPSTMSDREFADKIIADATKEKYAFLTIYPTLHESERYRKGLKEIYNI